jgi:CheY-like chemotaxis protein
MGQRLIGEDICLVWKPGQLVWPVYVDSTQVDQILVNLLVNARDAMPDTGTVTITTSQASLNDQFCAEHAESSPGDYVVLEVSDTGTGMDPKTLPHIFEPFFTTKPRGKGTGLGLSTVYGIVKQNGGFISVESQPGAGSTFRIFLPRHAGPSAPPPPASLPIDSVGHETLLVVEDEPNILELTQKVLTLKGYKVLTAAAPEQALRLARETEGPIHLVLTDVVMPGMNGRDLLCELLKLRPQAKCLFMSGYTADIIATRGVLDEGIQFIEKPFTPVALLQKVRQILDSSTTPAQRVGPGCAEPDSER